MLFTCLLDVHKFAPRLAVQGDMMWNDRHIQYTQTHTHTHGRPLKASKVDEEFCP